MSGPLIGAQRRSTSGAPQQRPTAAALLSQAGVPVVTAPTSRPVTVPFQRLKSPEGNRSDSEACGSLFATADTGSSAKTENTDKAENTDKTETTDDSE
jgi:predicted kinase